MKARLRAIADYAERFGWVGGHRVYTRVHRKRSITEVRVPGLAHSVFLRGGTSDVALFESIFIRNAYQLPFTTDPPRLIVDAGAHIGLASVFFARTCPDAAILSVEPDPGNFELLKRNTSPYANVEAVNGALWYESARLALEHPKPDRSAVRVAAGGGSGTVSGYSVDDLLQKTGGMPIDLFKIDIEGAELELFSKGAERWLSRVRVIAIELHDWFRPGCARAFYRAIADRSFRQYVKGDTVFVVFERQRP